MTLIDLKQILLQFNPDGGDPYYNREIVPHQNDMGHAKHDFYRQVLDSLEDYAIFTTDCEGNVSTWNKGSENLLGYAEGEIIGQNARIFFTKEDLEQDSAQKERATAFTNGRAVDERFHVRKDRTEFWASGLLFPLFDEHKQHVGFTKVMRDLTERKKAEEALINAKTFFKSIVDTVREPLIVLNKDLTINTANRAFYDVFKVSKARVNGMRIYEIANGKWDKAKLEYILEKEVPENNAFDSLEIEYESPQTGKRIMLINARRLYSIANRREMILLAVEDITDRKAMEQQRNDFIGIVSHELKTPVTSLKAFGQVLQLQLEQAGDQKMVNMLARMDAQVNKLTHLINDLLDATKIDGGKLRFQDEVFSFQQLLEEIVEEVQRTTNKHQIKIECNNESKLRGDRERIGQVLTNLLSNAIKYSPEAREILVKTNLEQDTLVCSVKDFGIGIPEDKVLKVFERFYRLTEDKLHTFPGVGLGLYISSEIVRRQGGKIWVESKLGEGSTFSFSLPVHYD